jgi:arylsulfatase A-like enzyme
MSRLPRRPSFLFILTDQQRADHLGCYGHRHLRTPNIDAIAHRGVTMDRAFVAAPICMPNRSTLLTGRMPSVHGVRHNGIALPLESVTFPDLLAAAGYRTAMVGKSHLQNFSGVPALRVGEPLAPGAVAPPPQLREAARRQPGDYLQEDVARWRAGNDFDVTVPFYGFQQVDLAAGHGDEVDGHYGRWLRERAPELDRERIGDPRRSAPGMELQQSWITRLPEELYPTSWVAERTIARLEQFARRPDIPFFLYCSFPDPHHPFVPPGRYRDMFDPADMTLPESWRQPAEQAPPHVRWLRRERDAGRAVRHSPAAYACTEREVREAMALSFGMITMVDDAVGRILGALARLGLADDTIVAFTTDHGEFLGDHQLMLKGPIHYQSLIRTPLIWADPRHPARHGQRSDEMCGTLDLARTVLDAAGVAPFNGMQGRSLAPAIAGSRIPRHDAVLIEEEGQRTYYGFDGPVLMRSLVTPRHRLSIYDGVRWGELYDLLDDPCEMRNLWEEPSIREVRFELLERMLRAMMSATDTSPLPTHLA